MTVDVLIPAFNEEQAIGKVIGEIPAELVQEIIVIDNGSTDGTVIAARKAGATVIEEKQKGYGAACLKGLSYLSSKSQDELPDVVVFLDGDYSDYPAQMNLLLAPIHKGDAVLVIGSRALGKKVKGSMTIPQRVGNWIATHMLYFLYGERFTDLGPFRAIKYDSLKRLNMQDQNFGWTVEMQLKAAKMKMPCAEVAVDYRKRIGKSKISGTLKGAVSAGVIIIKTLLKYR